jgi:hypothetical protein
MTPVCALYVRVVVMGCTINCDFEMSYHRVERDLFNNSMASGQYF